jgi:hypothetical protein
MNVQEGLVEARRRIEIGWTCKVWACDDKGDAVSIGSPLAYAYCAEGALLSLTPAGLEYGLAISLLNGLAGKPMLKGKTASLNSMTTNAQLRKTC